MNKASRLFINNGTKPPDHLWTSEQIIKPHYEQLNKPSTLYEQPKYRLQSNEQITNVPIPLWTNEQRSIPFWNEQRSSPSVNKWTTPLKHWLNSAPSTPVNTKRTLSSASCYEEIAQEPQLSTYTEEWTTHPVLWTNWTSSVIPSWTTQVRN